MDQLLATLYGLGTDAVGVFVRLAPFLLVGFLVAGVLHAVVPPRVLGSWLGRPGIGSVTRAALLGVPLPLCSCSVIPVAVELRRGGASRGATASFLVSTPETGADSILASFAVLHPVVAVFRPVAALVTAVVAGTVVEMVGGSAPPLQDAKTCCKHNHNTASTEASAPVEAASTSESGFVVFDAKRIAGAIRYGFDDLLGNTAPWLLPAILLTAVVTSLLDPHAMAAGAVSSRWLQMLILLVVGVPVYVCATAATPLAAGLVAAGFSPGAALVFMLVGPATNLVTLRAAAQTLGQRGAAAYGLCVAAVSIGCGVTLDSLLDAGGIAAGEIAHLGHEHTSLIDVIAAITLASLLIWHAARRLKTRHAR